MCPLINLNANLKEKNSSQHDWLPLNLLWFEPLFSCKKKKNPQKIHKDFYLFARERASISGEERHRMREKQTLWLSREPTVGLDPKTPGS